MQVLTSNNWREGADNQKLAFLVKFTLKNKFDRHSE